MTAMQRMLQFIPQVIMAGVDIGATPRAQLLDLAINSPHRKVGEAITLMFMWIDDAQRLADEINAASYRYSDDPNPPCECLWMGSRWDDEEVA
jgi:hypothetical protein